MPKKKSRSPRDAALEKEINTLANDRNILKMKSYVQHGRISTYEHCLDVARLSCRIGAALPVHMSDRDLIRGAFLHDYFLYDWHHHDKPWHGLTHPSTAKENAIRDYNITPLEQNIIESHMWPLTPLSVPRSKEAVVVNIADKICTIRETLFRRRGKTDEAYNSESIRSISPCRRKSHRSHRSGFYGPGRYSP